jgi:DNA (cytosine-5)-methyltransferase 1
LNELDIQSGASTGLRELALFAGAGGGILGGHLLGWRTICAVERDAYAAQVLAQRQNDRILKPFPIWSDVTTFDGRPWRGVVNVVSGGFPCQDISVAGAGAGLDGARSGLWSEFKRIVRDVEPDYVYVENSPALTFRGLGVVLSDLAELGFDAEWGIVSAADTDAPHLRDRIWIMAYAQRKGLERTAGKGLHGEGGEAIIAASRSKEMANAMRQRQQGIIAGFADEKKRQKQGQRSDRSRSHGFGRWPTEPDVGRVANGVAHRVDRIKALGNGQVPRVAATAWEILSR